MIFQISYNKPALNIKGSTIKNPKCLAVYSFIVLCSLIKIAYHFYEKSILFQRPNKGYGFIKRSNFLFKHWITFWTFMSIGIIGIGKTISESIFPIIFQKKRHLQSWCFKFPTSLNSSFILKIYLAWIPAPKTQFLINFLVYFDTNNF